MFLRFTVFSCCLILQAASHQSLFCSVSHSVGFYASNSNSQKKYEVITTVSVFLCTKASETLSQSNNVYPLERPFLGISNEIILRGPFNRKSHSRLGLERHQDLGGLNLLKVLVLLVFPARSEKLHLHPHLLYSNIIA